MSQEIQFILYNLPDEGGKVQVIIRDETLWCTQKAMSQLFGVDRTVISKHLKIYLNHLSYNKIQYVQNLHILLKMAKYTIRNFTIWMLLSQ